MKYTHMLALVFSVSFLTACSSSTNSVAEGSSTDASAAEAQSSEEAVADARDDGYRCERVAVTGTRMTQKYCTTRKQREEIARKAAAGVNRMTLKNTQAGGPSSN